MYKKLNQILPILILSALLAACAGNAVAQTDEISPTRVVENIEPTTLPEADPKSCPVTVRQDSAFTPPTPYDALGFKGHFWFGSEGLWTSLPEDGAWYGLPENPGGYTQKIFWWRDEYAWNEEPEPQLIVTGERLDAKSPRLNVSRATNAYAHDIGSAKLVGVEFPALGCWKITGQYGKAELSFVVWVAP